VAATLASLAVWVALPPGIKKRNTHLGKRAAGVAACLIVWIGPGFSRPPRETLVQFADRRPRGSETSHGGESNTLLLPLAAGRGWPGAWRRPWPAVPSAGSGLVANAVDQKAVEALIRQGQRNRPVALDRWAAQCRQDRCVLGLAGLAAPRSEPGRADPRWARCLVAAGTDRPLRGSRRGGGGP